MEYSLEPFKEPKGFLKILQWLFAICAFATTVNFSTQFGFTAQDVKCSLTTNVTTTTNVIISHSISYPFAIDHDDLEVINLKDHEGCKEVKEPQTLTLSYIGNAKSDSEFFVTTGVLSFLYATALIAVYLFADKLYYENTNLPIIDFVFTLVFAIFWLSGSSAWANGLNGLKAATNANEWNTDHKIRFNTSNSTQQPYNLLAVHAGVFGGLVISILFGFINFILWGTNLWTIYKETTWFESIMKNNAPSTSTTTGA